MSEGENSSFLSKLKEANIKSNQVSIEVYKNMIVDNLEYIEKNNTDTFSPLTNKYINMLKDIKEKDIGLNIIEPMIGVSLALYILFDSVINKDISLVQSHKKEFKRALLSTLEIAKHIKDERVKDHSLKAADVFLERFN